MSEGEAYLRIGVARASRKHPVLLSMLEDGRLHLSGIAKLAPVLTEANRDKLLARAEHKSKRKIQKLVAEIAPKPDVPSTMRKLPAPREPAKPAPIAELRPDAVEAPAPAAPVDGLRPDVVEAPAPPAPRPAPVKPTVVEPLGPSRYGVRFTASAELHDKLERLSALMPGADLASVVEAAVTEKLERLEAKRFGKTNKPRKSIEEADTSPGSRYISAPVKRFVFDRDGGQCTFVDQDGRRCTAQGDLEYHHHDPYGRGGDCGADNISLMCTTHNLLMAERDLGKDIMEPYRRSDDRVSEPLPAYGVSDSRLTPSRTSNPGQRRGRSHVDDEPGWVADAGAGSEQVEQARFTFAFTRAEVIVDTRSSNVFNPRLFFELALRPLSQRGRRSTQFP